MAVIRAQVALDRTTNLPEDVVVNTWHFSGLADATELADLTLALDSFYTTVGGFYGASMTGDGLVRYYDEADAEPRAPIGAPGVIEFTPASTILPEEVAICVSFQAEPVSGMNQARRRGRVFLGPLSTVSVTPTGEGRATLSQTNREAILTALVALRLAANTAGYTLGIWSPTASLFVAATEAWCDNAFDTIRSRGVGATARSTVNLI